MRRVGTVDSGREDGSWQREGLEVHEVHASAIFSECAQSKSQEVYLMK